MFSFLRQLTTWHCPHLQCGWSWAHSNSWFISCSPGPQQQGVRRAKGTDRRTPYRYVDPALHTMPAVPIMNLQSQTGPRIYVTTDENDNNIQQHFFQLCNKRNITVNLWACSSIVTSKKITNVENQQISSIQRCSIKDKQCGRIKT